MKRKPVLIVILILVAVLLVGAVAWGKGYYEARYVGEDYYTVIPQDFDMTPVTIHDMGGKDIGLGLKYELTAFNEEGESKEIRFTELDLTGREPQPGEYLHVIASEQIVVKWSRIDGDLIPEKAMEMLR